MAPSLAKHPTTRGFPLAKGVIRHSPLPNDRQVSTTREIQALCFCYSWPKRQRDGTSANVLKDGPSASVSNDGPSAGVTKDGPAAGEFSNFLI